MSKKTILWLSLISLIISIIGIVVFVPIVISAANTVASQCSQDQIQHGTCNVSLSAVAGAGFFVGILIFVVAGLVGLIAWVGALIRSAKMQTWGWFVVVLIFGGLGTLIYGIAGPANQQPMMMAAYPAPGYPPQPGYPPEQPGYPPQYPRQ